MKNTSSDQIGKTCSWSTIIWRMTHSFPFNAQHHRHFRIDLQWSSDPTNCPIKKRGNSGSNE
jgi:hypothetical protein